MELNLMSGRMKPEGWATSSALGSYTAQHKKPNLVDIHENLFSWLSLSFHICETGMTCCLFSLPLGFREVIYLF